MENWQMEMHRLLEIFQTESTSSLRKINRYFVASGQPFDENFHQYFLKMSNLRLDASFNIVLFEHENRMRNTPSTSASTYNGSKVLGNANLSSSAEDHGNSSNVDGNFLDLKTEHHIDDPVEISDSSDDEEVPVEPKMVKISTEINALAQKNARDSEKRNNVSVSIEVVDSDDDEGGAEGSAALMINGASGGQTESIAFPELNSGAGNSDGETINTDENDLNGIEDDVKTESKLEIESPSGAIELLFVTFNPNAANGDLNEESDETNSEPLADQQQPSTSTGAQKQSKESGGKRFECNKCAYTAQYKCQVKSHQAIHEAVKPFKCAHCDYAAGQKVHLVTHLRTHVQQKVMGVVQDPNSGLFKCTHCDQRFTKWYSLKRHLAFSHKNNQRLFNCIHCMRRFTQKSKKDRHEAHCKNHRYECFLCKKYDTSKLVCMQRHMRIHSGAKPFQCVICLKCFRQKSTLRHHFNTIHNKT